MVSETAYVEWIDSEAVALNRLTGELHYLNPTAAAVLAFVQEHGLERGRAEAAAHFGLSGDGLRELDDLLEDLRERGIVAANDVPTDEPEPGDPRAPSG